MIGAACGGEGKITWTVITNKSGVQKQKKFCVEKRIFGVNFRSVANLVLKKFGKFVLIV
jgi:hypothetical protein